MNAIPEQEFVITRADVRLVRVPPKSNWEDATHRVSAIEIIVVELHAAGRIARGLSYTVGVGGTAVRSLLKDYCLNELLGKDARQVTQLWQHFYRHLHRTGFGAITTLALAAIDTALWELRALVAQRPLAVELGGAAPRIPAYTSGIDLQLTPEELYEMQIAEKRKGYRWFKIKVGRPSLSEDVARVAAAREAIGPESKLLLDANQCWDYNEARRRSRAFEPYDIAWLEEPLTAENIQGHKDLRQMTGIPIAVGESLYTLEAFQAYLTAGAVDIVQADIARVGGFTPWLRIADLAAAWHRPVAPHFLAELSIHGLCGISNGLVLENVRGGSLHDLGLTKSPLSILDGYCSPPAGTGHGIDFDLDACARAALPDDAYTLADVVSRKAIAT